MPIPTNDKITRQLSNSLRKTNKKAFIDQWVNLFEDHAEDAYSALQAFIVKNEEHYLSALKKHSEFLTLPIQAQGYDEFKKAIKGTVYRLFSKTDGERMDNALMHAARNHPKAVPELLKVIQTFDEEKRFAILKQTNNVNANALMIAANYHPKAVPELLKVIQTFDEEKQFETLKQTNYYNWNALMTAARNHPQAVPELLKVIQTFDEKKQFEILKQTDKYNWNALMIAARNHPQSVPELLKVIQTFDEEKQFEILKQTTNDNFNALMLAARHRPAAVPELLKIIQTFDEEKQFEILKQTNNDNLNALMLAARHHPQAIPELLKVIQTFDEEKQFEILKQTSQGEQTTSDWRCDYWGGHWNALLIAANYHSRAVPKLLKVIQTLDEKNRLEIFKQSLFTSGGVFLTLDIAPYVSSFSPELQKELIGAMRWDDILAMSLLGESAAGTSLRLAVAKQTILPASLKYDFKTKEEKFAFQTLVNKKFISKDCFLADMKDLLEELKVHQGKLQDYAQMHGQKNKEFVDYASILNKAVQDYEKDKSETKLNSLYRVWDNVLNRMKDDKSFNPKESTFTSYFLKAARFILRVIRLVHPVSYIERLVGVDNSRNKSLFFKPVIDDAHEAMKKAMTRGMAQANEALNDGTENKPDKEGFLNPKPSAPSLPDEEGSEYKPIYPSAPGIA